MTEYDVELGQLESTYERALKADVSALKRAIAGASESSIIGVGSGGSFTVATLLSNLHEAYTGRVSRAATPLEIICNPTLAASSPVFFISAEGKNPDIVEALDRARLRDALVGWSDLYLRALTQLAGAEPELYTCGERRRISDLLKAAVRKSVRLPSFSTLLRISAMQAVSLVDLIRAPVESCSPRLCRIGPATGPAVTRGKTDSESWLRAKGALLRELHSNATLRSKNSILTELGLSVSGFWQHYPDLAVKYEIERLTRLNHRRDVHKDAALSAARRLVSEAAETGVCPTVRRGGEQVRLETGASKQVSEDAMRFVLREHDAGRYRG